MSIQRRICYLQVFIHKTIIETSKNTFVFVIGSMFGEKNTFDSSLVFFINIKVEHENAIHGITVNASS